MFSEIDGLSHEELQRIEIKELVDYLEEKYRLEVPQLKEEQITMIPREVRGPLGSGMEFTFVVPFEGDGSIFSYRASTFLASPPLGIVNDSELCLTYLREDHDADAVKAQLRRDLSEIRQCLKFAANDIVAHNSSLRADAAGRIEARKEKLLKDRAMVAAIGFPLTRRRDAPKTYAVPAVRRRVPIPRPSPSAPALAPEPVLEMEAYEQILNTISQMARVIELSPEAFRRMGEEDLRFMFLVPLNSQYVGQTTGETFNFEGKTDILIRVEGRNIFVAECKFWDGPDSLRKAIDQLLGYTSWRDTKTALLVFNRIRQFTTVLEKIPEVVQTHANFKKRLEYKSETGFRFVLHHRDDKNRELILTVLAFEVPA